MKFIIETEVKINDEELLERINNDIEWNEMLHLYNSLNEISEDEIIKWCYLNYKYFRFDISKIRINK